MAAVAGQATSSTQGDNGSLARLANLACVSVSCVEDARAPGDDEPTPTVGEHANTTQEELSRLHPLTKQHSKPNSQSVQADSFSPPLLFARD